MSIVRPFRGLRPKPEYAAKLASPPYDVLSGKEARIMAQGNPYSFLRVNKSEIEFDDSVNPYSQEVYLRARQNLEKFERDGIMIRDPRPCFYIYRLTMDDRSQTGLVALTSVDEYDNKKIKKHENTRPEKVNDRANHIDTVGAQVGPIFSIFRYDNTIDQIFETITSNSPEIDFTSDDGIRHELWVISDQKIIDQIIAAFAGLDCLYIADGHHRSESAAELCHRYMAKNKNHTGAEIYNFFLNVLFPDNELKIMSYDRVVKDLNGLTLSQIMEKASAKFRVANSLKEAVPQKLHQFGIYCEKKWFLLEAVDGSFDPQHPTQSIDASILANNFIAPILGIADPRTDKRIEFVGGIRGIAELVKLVDSGEFKIAFALYPTSVEQLLNVADRGEVMPPKSTWFEPKLRDGMVVNLLTE